MPNQGKVYETVVCLSVTLFAVAVAKNVTESLPPVLEHGPPPHQLYNAGKTIDLRCKARPPPPDHGPHQYEWYRNGNKIETSDRYQFHSQEADSSLRISTPRDQNDAEPIEGYFQCKVSNEAGIAMSNVSLLEAAVFERTKHQNWRKVRNKTVSEGHSLKLLCDHVISVPPATIRWVTVGCAKGCTDTQHVTLDDRISIDDNGSLVFSHVTLDDEQGDRVYKCYAYNSIRRKGIYGSYHRIKVKGGPQNHVPTLLYSTQSPVVALQGSNVTLTCFFAGRPTPNVTWRKAGNTILDHNKDYDVTSALNNDPEKSRITNHTHHIHLTHVQPHHAGYYECFGENEAGESHITRIKVEVEAAPVITSVLRSVNVSEGNPAVFTCKGAGIPAPQVQWYKNDQLINNGTNLTSHWQINEDSSQLIIESTKLTDTSTIHCNLTNRHGSVLLATFLIVNEGPEDKDVVEQIVVTKPSLAEHEEEKKEPEQEQEKVQEERQNLIPELETVAPNNTNQSNVIPVLPPGDLGVAEASQGSEEKVSNKSLKYIMMNIVVPVLAGCFIIFIVIAILCLVSKRGKRTYKVGERERKIGRPDKDEYDSDDSGYPDDRPANQLVHHIAEEEAPTELCLLEAVV